MAKAAPEPQVAESLNNEAKLPRGGLVRLFSAHADKANLKMLAGSPISTQATAIPVHWKGNRENALP